MPSSGIFYKAQWAWQVVKLTRLKSIYTSKKVWKFLIKFQLTKTDSKRTRGWKCPASCQLGLINPQQIHTNYAFLQICATHFRLFFVSMPKVKGQTKFNYIVILTSKRQSKSNFWNKMIEITNYAFFFLWRVFLGKFNHQDYYELYKVSARYRWLKLTKFFHFGFIV